MLRKFVFTNPKNPGSNFTLDENEMYEKVKEALLKQERFSSYEIIIRELRDINVQFTERPKNGGQAYRIGMRYEELFPGYKISVLRSDA